MAQSVTDSSRSQAGAWVSYRPEIKVLDCTVRDGGLMNDHGFDDKLVKAVYDTAVEAGIDYLELGYKASKRLFAPDKFGDWKFCDEDAMRRIVGENDTPLKLSAMADAEKCDYKEDIIPRADSVLDMVRVATYIHQIPIALDMVKHSLDQGYEVTVNLMAISAVPERELDEGLELLCESGAQAIYIVDSFGTLYSEQVQYLARKYLGYARNNGMEVGMHAHNNQQLAFANTIEGIMQGCNLLDATLAGLGRGAGNCQLELLLGFLHNPKFRLRPVLKCIQEHIEPLRGNLGWGFDIPYMITGFLNQHPRAAIAFQNGPDRGDYVKFFDQAFEDM